jgi:hypothetical protein
MVIKKMANPGGIYQDGRKKFKKNSGEKTGVSCWSRSYIE